MGWSPFETGEDISLNIRVLKYLHRFFLSEKVFAIFVFDETIFKKDRAVFERFYRDERLHREWLRGRCLETTADILKRRETITPQERTRTGEEDRGKGRKEGKRTVN